MTFLKAKRAIFNNQFVHNHSENRLSDFLQYFRFDLETLYLFENSTIKKKTFTKFGEFRNDYVKNRLLSTLDC